MRHKQPYYESTVVRLYHYHGSAVEPSPVVLDWEMQTINGQTFPVANGINRSFDSMSDARNYTENDPTSQIGGIGHYPEERVPALEHYRLVGTSDRSAQTSFRWMLGKRKVARGALGTPIRTQFGMNQQVLNFLNFASQPNWVKVFERVPGATIHGEGAPSNSQVQTAVRMNVPASNTSFVYRARTTADENGEFSFTVPYSTTGYDNWAPKKGTRTSTCAPGPSTASARSSSPTRAATPTATSVGRT
jgi:dolichyl-diphosphooligosaccharide--protein glycosyltransferase